MREIFFMCKNIELVKLLRYLETESNMGNCLAKKLLPYCTNTLFSNIETYNASEPLRQAVKKSNEKKLQQLNTK